MPIFTLSRGPSPRPGKGLAGITAGLLVALCCVVSGYEMRHPAAYYRAETWPPVVLRINKTTSLKEVFDAGLRPYPTDPESHVLEFKHVNLKLGDSSMKLLPPVAVETAEVRPKPSGLYNLVLRSQSLTTSEARDAMTGWLPFIGKSPADLDAFLAEVARDPVSYDDPHFGKYPQGFGGSWNGAQQEQYSVWFQQAYNRDVPLKLTVQVSWHQIRSPLERNTFFEGRVPPPSGYEKESMDRPDDFGPDDVVEMMQSKGIPFSKGLGLTPEITDVAPPTPEPRKQPAAVPPPIATSEPHRFPFWTLALVLLCVLAGCAILRKRFRQN